MEVLHNLGAQSSLQSHIAPGTVSNGNGATTATQQSSDNQTNSMSTTLTNSNTRTESLDDITGDDLLELQSIAEDAQLTYDSVVTGRSLGEELALDEHVPVAPEESPQVNVAINNVVCTFSTRCHLNLKEIALNGANVELKKAQGMLNMKIRKPSATASIWSSGKITITGASSEDNCKKAARKIARRIQKIGFNVKFSSFKIVNVLGTCSLPFGILLTEFSNAHIGTVQYEPELHPGATYQIKDIKATLKIFSTGSMTITAPKVDTIQVAVERVFPMVYQFKKPKKVDPKELKYIEEILYDSSDAEMISDNSDLDLEPGEIPTTKSRRVGGAPAPVRSMPQQQRGGARRGGYGRHRRAVIAETVINEDDYGSDSDDDCGMDSDSD